MTASWLANIQRKRLHDNVANLFGAKQVSLVRQDLPKPAAERRAQIAGLAGLLGDDQGRHARHPTQFQAIGYPGSGNIQWNGSAVRAVMRPSPRGHQLMKLI